MKKNTNNSKKMLFEMMHKVGGMPLKENLILDGIDTDLPKEMIKYYIGKINKNGKEYFSFNIPYNMFNQMNSINGLDIDVDDLNSKEKDENGKIIDINNIKFRFLYPIKNEINTRRSITKDDIKHNLGKWSKYLDVNLSKKIPNDSGEINYVLKINKSDYPNYDELNKELNNDFTYDSHNGWGNLGGWVNKSDYEISSKKSTPEYWYVIVEFWGVLDV